MNFSKYNSMQDKSDLVKLLNKLIDDLIFKIHTIKLILSNLDLLSSGEYFLK
ncbi:hypothetical protein [Clostridium sporogenes]|uniref:hypothetical protein n=1 Tax=Clostridium sporogenes TaxID=1509 RepID=UPI001F393CD4|nr:hypothetical protein [Clostridium sporogenes]UJA34043.1 hypothetical protein L0894_03455 [Clostridium sporogenes]